MINVQHLKVVAELYESNFTDCGGCLNPPSHTQKTQDELTQQQNV